MSPIILAIIFAVLSVGLLFYICFNNNVERKLKKFYIAATSVYVSGTILITIFTLVINEITLPFVSALEFVVLFVFVFDIIILRKIYYGMNEMHDSAMKNMDNQDKKTEDDK